VPLVKEKYWAIIAVVLLGLGGFEVYWLSRGADDAEPPPVRPTEYFPHLEVGEIAPAFDAAKMDGGSERVSYPEAGQKTLVFVMSLTCGACTSTIPHWNRIAAQTKGQARALGLIVGSYENEAELLREKGLTFPALRFPDQKTQFLYKVTKVPQTLLVGPKGKVEQVIVGELAEPQIEDLIARAKGSGTE